MAPVFDADQVSPGSRRGLYGIHVICSYKP